MNARIPHSRWLALVGLTFTLVASAQAQAERPGAAKPAPDFANVRYGPHERHVLDLWRAKAPGPTPLVVYLHGGGFHQGSKENLPAALLKRLLAQGISVMAVNYRLSPEVSFPSHYMDCARAIQFARSHAQEWNVDPARIGATGSSAGAGTALWIGFHDDMANPQDADPVLRQSTRLACIAVTGAQSSYDPRDIKAWVGEAAAQHSALEGFYGLAEGERESTKAQIRYMAASPINYVTSDDPPVYAFYSEAREIPANAKRGQGIHHINLGLKLKERMESLGLECTVRHRDEGAKPDEEIAAFFARHLLKAR